MKTFLNGFTSYVQKILRKWVFWILGVLDLIAIVLQIFFPALRLPQLLYLLIILVGLFWASYQVYCDTIAMLPVLPVEPPPYQLLPIDFRINLTDIIPYVEVWFYIVNYQSKEISLASIDVIDLHVQNACFLKNIQWSGEGFIRSRQPERIMCRRNLIGSETRILEKMDYQIPINGRVWVSSHSVTNRGKKLSYSINDISIKGWLNKG